MDLHGLQKLLIEMALTPFAASNAKVIQVQSIVVQGWPSMKCRYGCDCHAKYFSCPPFAPTPEETQAMLASYEEALLVEFSALADFADQKKPRQAMLDLERLAFLEGCYKAFAFAGGPCRLCKRCQAEEFAIANRSTMKYCLHRTKLRPSMEGSGIDVYATVRAAGLSLEVVKNKDQPFKSFGLLLLA